MEVISAISEAAPEMTDKKKILFLCTRNSARSIMAEAILNKLGGNKYLAFSAGIEPGNNGINQNTIKVLESQGIMTATLRSKNWNEFLGREFDYVISLCNQRENESCPPFPGEAERLQWNIPNPDAQNKDETTKMQDFFKIFTMLKQKINEELLGA